MQFLQPAFLWGLLALAIPIIIHLFHFRKYKKVLFTNVRFLRELKDERNARRKLRNFLVLLMRLLAVAALIFAFAQPYIANKKKNLERKLVSVFVDNSYSMNALSRDIPLIDKAKLKAEQIIDAYNETDRFQILTHNYSGVSSRILTKEEALASIEAIAITPSVKDLDLVVNRMVQSFKELKGDKSFYLLSDFQKNISQFPTTIDTSYTLQLIPFQSVQNSNLSIDTAYLVSPTPLLNQVNQMIIEITNQGQEDQENVRINIQQNGQNKPSGTLNILAGQTKVDTLELSFSKAGTQAISLSMDDYPIQFDDVYHMSISIQDNANVLSIFDQKQNRYLKALFTGVEEMTLSHANVNNINYNELDQYSLIILDDLNTLSSGLISELKAYVNKGGNLSIFPSKNGNKEEYNQLLTSLKVNSITQWEDAQREVLKINTEEFVFNKVFATLNKNINLPTTNGNFVFTNFAANGGEHLLKYRDGSPFLSKYKTGDGQVFICASSLEREINPLVENAEIFVPMIYKMSLSQAAKTPDAYTLGKANNIKVKNSGDDTEMLYKISGNIDFIPQQVNQGNFTQITTLDEIPAAGFYDITKNGESIKQLAFNYNRKESEVSCYKPSELSEKFGDQVAVLDQADNDNLAKIIKEREQGIFLWRLFLILALVFLGIETLILRFWKT